MALNRRDFLKMAAGAGAATLALAATGEIEPASAKDTTPEEAKAHPAMLYDTTLCVGCRACQSACREWNGTTVEPSPDGLFDQPTDLSGKTWTLIQYAHDDATNPADLATWSYVKVNCMHCLAPACVSACPIEALEKTPEGPVVYDPNRCFGCRYCMVACPYGVPRYQWESITPLVQKCSFCSGTAQHGGATDEKNRLAQGLQPACVEACPAGALIGGTREELLAEAHKRIEANPDKYYENRVYGETEAGGTLQLYLSHYPFEKIGLPKLDAQPKPQLTTLANWSVPAIIVGVGGLMTGAYITQKGKGE